MRGALQSLIETAVQNLVREGYLPSEGLPAVEVADPKDPSHGDFACTFALAASKVAGKPPREIAERLVGELKESPPLGAQREEEGVGGGGPGTLIAAAEIAGPGFINIRLNPAAVAAYVPMVLELGVEGFKNSATRPSDLRPQTSDLGPRTSPLPRLNVEFVSVNPNGPITVGSGRGAAFGSTLCNVLEAAGHSVHREYYINDGVNSEQMRLFAESVRAISRGESVPENGYKGDYVFGVADFLCTKHGKAALLTKSAEFGSLSWFQRESEDEMIKQQRVDLSSFGVWFETFFSELSLHDSGAVAACIEELHAKGAADEEPYQLEILKKKGEPDRVERHEQPVEDEEEVGGEQLAVDGQEPAGTTSPLEGEPAGSTSPLEGEPAGTTSPLEGEVGERSEPGEGNPDRNLHPPAPSPSRGLQGEGEPQATLWLRSTKFGDQKDRVLRRKDGRLTYIASDVAYHKDKFSRGSKPDAEGKVQPADKLLTILGPDHHGYIGRLQAVVGALLEEVDGKRLTVDGPEPPSPTPGSSGAGGEERRAKGEVGSDQSDQSDMPDRSDLSDLERALYKSPAERDACQAALEEAKKRLEVVIFQIVRFVKNGKPAPMRKRDGNIYSLRDLMAEIGKNAAPNAPEAEQMRIGCDVARFFYLMRSHDTHMDFDLDLAEKQSDENPVYYVQYAHARVCSVIAKAAEAGLSVDGKRLTVSGADRDEGTEGQGNSLAANRQPPTANVSLLTHPRELALIKKILDLPFEVRRCAEDYGVHRLTTYAMDLARAYHGFYDSCRVIQPEEPELSQARLALCEAARTGLRAVFQLLGISAPERMERAESAA